MSPATSPDVIYRYQPMRPDAIDLIKTGRLWFSDPSRFNDPFDFRPSFKEWETEIARCLDQSREAVRWTDFSRYSRNDFLEVTQHERNRLLQERCRAEQRKFMKNFAKEFRVTCFSETNDNILMWSHYASCHSGLCFGIRPAKIPAPPAKALRWAVAYRDKRLPISHKAPNEIALRKAKLWKYEKEWRILMAPSDLTSGRRPLPRAPKKPRFESGYFSQLPWDAIESVRFGALVDRKKRSVVLKALQADERRHIQAIQMHLSVDRFALDQEVLQR